MLEALLEKMEVPLPEGIVTDELNSRRQSIEQQLVYAGMTMDAYLEEQGQTLEEFEADLERRVRDAVAAQFVLDAIAKKEELGVDQNELTQLMVRRAQQSGQDPQEFANHMFEHNHIPELVQEILRGKALAQIVESATVTDESGNPVELKNLLPDGTIGEPEAESERADGDVRDDAADAAAAAERAATDRTGPRHARSTTRRVSARSFTEGLGSAAWPRSRPGPTVLDALSLLAEVGRRAGGPERARHPSRRAGPDPGRAGPPRDHRRGLPRPDRRAERRRPGAGPGGGHRRGAAARGRPARPVRELRGQRADRRPAAPRAAAAGDPDGGPPRRRATSTPSRTPLAEAFPEATGRLVVFLHGLCENESYWNRHRDRTGTTYAEMLAERGWTPLMLRANTGLPLRENGAALTALLQRVVEAWPVPVTRIALVGHSLGGLVMRAAGAVASEVEEPWSRPGHRRGHPRARRTSVRRSRGASGTAAAGSAMLPETAAFGRILDWRSRGVHDLVAGLAEDVPPLPHARYHLVAATLTSSERHPVGHVVGDLLVRPRSAYGRDRRRTPVPRRRRAARRADRPLRAAQPPRRARGDCSAGWPRPQQTAASCAIASFIAFLNLRSSP